MHVKFEDGTLYVEGTFTETDDFSELVSFFSRYENQHTSVPLDVDLSGVTRSNSVGLLEWLRLINDNTFPMRYVRAPVWMAEQFSLLKGLTPPRTTVHSFYAPFYDMRSEKHMQVLLEVGKDIPLLKSYESFTFPREIVQHGRLEPDFDREVFLHFLTALCARAGARAS